MVLPDRWKEKFSESDIEAKKEIAKFKAGDRNPYSWNMEFYEYEDGSGYEARFTTCGICTLMNELGLTKLIPAMCRLDYTMSEADCVSNLPGIYNRFGWTVLRLRLYEKKCKIKCYRNKSGFTDCSYFLKFKSFFQSLLSYLIEGGRTDEKYNKMVCAADA